MIAAKARFRWLANEHFGLSEQCVKDVLATMDDFKDEMDHVQVHKFSPPTRLVR